MMGPGKDHGGDFFPLSAAHKELAIAAGFVA
jgi:hypothetical protein